MPSNLTRRAMMLSGSAVLMGAMASPALALTDAQARTLVDRAVSDINKTIASGKSVGSMISDFERIFGRYADVSIMASTALGPDARRATPAQFSAYVKAYQGYIARKYGKRFNEFVGGTVTVQSVRAVKSYHEVKTIVNLRGKSPFEVNFLVSDKSGKDLFFDMIIEGVSLRLSERTEIGAMLDRRKGDIDAMIADLRQAG